MKILFFILQRKMLTLYFQMSSMESIGSVGEAVSRRYAIYFAWLNRKETIENIRPKSGNHLKKIVDLHRIYCK